MIGIMMAHIPWHSLDKTFSKMIEGYSDLHVLVLRVGITVSQKHNLVMVGHVVVGDGDGSGSMNGINQPITTIRQRAMIDPNMLRVEDRHSIAVRLRPKPRVLRRVSDVGVPRRLAIVNVNSVNDHVAHVVYGDAAAAGDVHTGASAVDCLERVHQKLLFQRDYHVPLEDYPQGFVLYGGVTEGSGLWIHGVVVAGVCHLVDPTVSSADGVLAEPDGAVG